MQSLCDSTNVEFSLDLLSLLTDGHDTFGGTSARTKRNRSKSNCYLFESKVVVELGNANGRSNDRALNMTMETVREPP